MAAAVLCTKVEAGVLSAKSSVTTIVLYNTTLQILFVVHEWIPWPVKDGSHFHRGDHGGLRPLQAASVAVSVVLYLINFIMFSITIVVLASRRILFT